MQGSNYSLYTQLRQGDRAPHHVPGAEMLTSPSVKRSGAGASGRGSTSAGWPPGPARNVQNTPASDA